MSGTSSPRGSPGRTAAVPFLLWLVAGCAPGTGSAPAPRPGGDPVEPVVTEPPDHGPEGALRIASIFPALGRFALSGIQSANGARLAVEDVNRDGGVHGRPVALLEYRTGSYFVDARRAAGRAADGPALAIVGSNSSGLSRAIAEVAESRGLVQVSNVSTAQDLTWDPATGADRRFVFRVCASDVVMARRLAEFARDHLNARRAAVLYEVGRTYSARLARSFVEHFRDPGAGRTTAEFFYLPLETDFRGQLRDVAAFAPDVLLVPGSFTDSTLVAVQARRLGLEATLLGGDAWSNRLLFARGGPARPAYHADLCFPPAAFQERYRIRFGDDADGCRAVLAYDAVVALAAALRELGPLQPTELAGGLDATRVRLRGALAAVRIAAQTGRLSFDHHGDPRRGVGIVEVRPGPDGSHVSRPYLWLGEQ